jgi:hypothetical protein
MPDQTVVLPLSCYIALAVAWVAAIYSFSLRKKGIGLPMLTVVGTVIAWYFGDAFYNDYQKYTLILGLDILDRAWWQVALFLIGFCIFAPFMHRWINKKLLGQNSHFLSLFHRGGLNKLDFQQKITAANTALLGAWIALMFIALLKTNFDFMGMFFPYISGKAYPWLRGRVGGGLDALIAFASYIQIMLTACFGIVYALSKNPLTRIVSGGLWLLSAPWFFLDRTRNTMLAVLLPGLLTYVFLRLRVNFFIKIAVLGLTFLVVEGWMRFVIQARSEANIAYLFQQVGVAGVSERLRTNPSKHAGLNMFEELGWINKFIDDGRYTVNNGGRYFAELVNPIPRTLWRAKPMIGIDYAIARGQTFGLRSDKLTGGVGATISTGMIGQGIVNFGPFFGVLAAALLMAIWAAILARQDLKGDKTGRLLLYMLGMVLTFNLGRDITLLTLYPFVFGSVMLFMWSKANGER